MRVFSTAAVLVLTFGVLTAIFQPAYQEYRPQDVAPGVEEVVALRSPVVEPSLVELEEQLLAEEKAQADAFRLEAELKKEQAELSHRQAEEASRLAQSEAPGFKVEDLLKGTVGKEDLGDDIVEDSGRDRLSELDDQRNELSELERDYRAAIESMSQLLAGADFEPENPLGEPTAGDRIEDSQTKRKQRAMSEITRSLDRLSGNLVRPDGVELKDNDGDIGVRGTTVDMPESAPETPAETVSEHDLSQAAAIAGGYASATPEPEEQARENRIINNSMNLARQEGGAGSSVDDKTTKGPEVRARQAAQLFFAHRDRLDGVATQPATGYWANTYVPGDPIIRYLESQLERWASDGTALSTLSTQLVQTVMPNRQPFDAPGRASLNVFMQADKAAITDVSRLRVQIGIQAAERRGGHRPTMNVAVVVDSRLPFEPAAQEKIGSLLRALGAAAQSGDNFSLLSAADGGLVIAPGEFRRGSIEVALGQLFDSNESTPRETLSLTQTARLATEQLNVSRTGQGALGTSLVLLVTASAIGEELADMEALAHQNAVNGVGLSVVSLGGSADLSELDSLVLLGQGHRRIYADTDDPRGLVDDELRAASRAVARALRLRIRLAAGVHLIDVLGSRSLEAHQAQRVREAEQSIDLTLSRELGIEADRGEDEEGIQIVIPSFYAGDTHVILLDVIVDSLGPVAEVTIRYKDLLERENGVARASLEVPAGRPAAGLLELNVMKNHVTHLLTQTARQASRQLSGGDLGGARTKLERAHRLVKGLRLEVPEWHDDRELASDENLLAAFVDILSPSGGAHPGDRQRIADSLDFVAARRVLPAYESQR